MSILKFLCPLDMMRVYNKKQFLTSYFYTKRNHRIKEKKGFAFKGAVYGEINIKYTLYNNQNKI